MKSFLLFAVSFLFVGAAFGLTGNTMSGELIVPPSSEELLVFIQALGGWKGLGALGIAMIVVQGLLLLARTSLINIEGKWRLFAVLLLSTISGVIALLSAGVPLTEALLHSQTLAAFQVLLHQIYKQFIEKKEA